MALPKFIGRDCELSTTGISPEGRALDPWEVTKEILHHIDAAFEPLGRSTWSREMAGDRGSLYSSPHSSDCLRRWGPEGSCFYSDCSHVEICTPATLFPRAYAARCLSVLRVAEAARRRAESAAEHSTRYSLAASNVDVLDPSISWGTHLSVAVSTPLFEDLFTNHQRPSLLGFVASAVAAAIPFFGSGYLLPLKDETLYSLSARAHHISCISTHSTTEAHRRGLLNARREPHGEGQERLHLIGFDFSLACAALKSSFLQCCLAAAEEGYCELNLYEPVRALHIWAWNVDPGSARLSGKARLVDGRRITLPRYVRELSTRLLEMCEAGLITEQVAPESREMLPRIIELTHHVEEGSLERSAPQLDWAAKLLCIQGLCRDDGITFGDATTRLADHDFTNTDPDRGLFWRLWDRGLIDPLVDMGDVDACLRDGPPEGRGWGRGRIIQEFFQEITDIDWSYIELRRDDGRWSPRLRIEMPRPYSLARSRFEPVLEQASRLEEVQDLLQDDDSADAHESDPLTDIRSRLAPAPTVDRQRG